MKSREGKRKERCISELEKKVSKYAVWRVTERGETCLTTTYTWKLGSNGIRLERLGGAELRKVSMTRQSGSLTMICVVCMKELTGWQRH